MDRQTHAPDDWELRETSSPPFVAREPEQLTPDHDEESVEAGPAPMLGPQGHWGRVLHHTNWSRHELCHRPGTVSSMFYCAVFPLGLLLVHYE